MRGGHTRKQDESIKLKKEFMKLPPRSHVVILMQENDEPPPRSQTFRPEGEVFRSLRRGLIPDSDRGHLDMMYFSGSVQVFPTFPKIHQQERVTSTTEDPIFRKKLVFRVFLTLPYPGSLKLAFFAKIGGRNRGPRS